MKKTFMMILLVLVAQTIFAISADEILKKLDSNETYKTIKFEGDMIITISGKKYIKNFTAYAKGDKNFFMEFNNPDDAGTKYMKKDGNLYVYSDDLEEVMPITGHMLKESMMGSDLSYEDATDNKKLHEQYNAMIIKETTYNNESVWVLELTAKTKYVSYPKRKLWVSKSKLVALKEELYALSGVKLKEQTIDEVQLINGKNFPTKITIKDLIRRNSNTVFVMKNIKMDIDISDSAFDLRNLEW